MATADSSGMRTPGKLNVRREVSTMESMTPKELKLKYEEVFGEQCRSNNRQWLIKRIAWRMQANVYGGLSERAKRRAMELADFRDIRMSPPKETATPAPQTVNTGHDPRVPLPGTTLLRTYKSQEIAVDVLPDGFEWNGESYRSLSAVAKAITGTHTNGFLFFRLNGGRR